MKNDPWTKMCVRLGLLSGRLRMRRGPNWIEESITDFASYAMRVREDMIARGLKFGDVSSDRVVVAEKWL